MLRQGTVSTYHTPVKCSDTRRGNVDINVIRRIQSVCFLDKNNIWASARKILHKIIYGLAGEKVYINNIWASARKILRK